MDVFGKGIPYLRCFVAKATDILIAEYWIFIYLIMIFCHTMLSTRDLYLSTLFRGWHWSLSRTIYVTQPLAETASFAVWKRFCFRYSSTFSTLDYVDELYKSTTYVLTYTIQPWFAMIFRRHGKMFRRNMKSSRRSVEHWQAWRVTARKSELLVPRLGSTRNQPETLMSGHLPLQLSIGNTS